MLDDDDRLRFEETLQEVVEKSGRTIGKDRSQCLAHSIS